MAQIFSAGLSPLPEPLAGWGRTSGLIGRMLCVRDLGPGQESGLLSPLACWGHLRVPHLLKHGGLTFLVCLVAEEPTVLWCSPWKDRNEVLFPGGEGTR